jgi:flagellar basal-body rod modification protein FlgD
VLDSSGVPVRTIAASGADAKAGDHSFTWDGKDMLGSSMPDGSYTLRITAVDGGGAKVDSTTYVEGQVSAIELLNGQSMITINGGKVPVSQVIGVSQPAASGGSNSTNTTDQTSGQAA